MSQPPSFFDYDYDSSFFVQEGIEMEDSAEEETVMDIDSSDKNNSLAVVEYINDLYDFYKNNEVITFVPLLSIKTSVD